MGLSVLPVWPGSGPEPTWMEPAPFCSWDLSPGVLAGSGADGEGSPYLLGSVFPSGVSPSQAGLGLEVLGACSPLPGSKLKWFRFESSLQCGGTCWLRTPIPCHYDIRPEECWALPGWGELGTPSPSQPRRAAPTSGTS